MTVNLPAHQVTAVCFDFAVVLRTSGGFELRIEVPFSLNLPGGTEVRVNPEHPGPNASLVLALLYQDVASCTSEETGELRASFANGDELSIEPHDSFEAWSLVGPNGVRVVCLPGGGTSQWGLGG